MVSVSVSKNSKILVSEKVLVSVSKNFGIKKSIGFGIGKIWYQNKYRIRYRKKLASEKSFGFVFFSDFGFRHTLLPRHYWFRICAQLTTCNVFFSCYRPPKLNLHFLGVHSTNPLPAASWLVKLTSHLTTFISLSLTSSLPQIVRNPLSETKYLALHLDNVLITTTTKKMAAQNKYEMRGVIRIWFG